MPNLDLTDDEHAALVRLVKHALEPTALRCHRDCLHSGRPLRSSSAATPRVPLTAQGLCTAEAHFNGADIVVHSVNRAQSREAGVDYRSDVIGTGRVPDRSQTPPSPQ